MFIGYLITEIQMNEKNQSICINKRKHVAFMKMRKYNFNKYIQCFDNLAC